MKHLLDSRLVSFGRWASSSSYVAPNPARRIKWAIKAMYLSAIPSPANISPVAHQQSLGGYGCLSHLLGYEVVFIGVIEIFVP